MSEAIFALIGATLGVLGTIAADFVRGKREDRRLARDQVRAAASDLAANVARVRRLAIRVDLGAQDEETLDLLENTFSEARAAYERLCLVLDSPAAIRQARLVVHYTDGMMSAAQFGKYDYKGNARLMFDHLAQLYVEVRRENGDRQADKNTFLDPAEGLPARPLRQDYRPGLTDSVGDQGKEDEVGD